MSGQSSAAKAPRATRQFLVHLDAELIRRVKITAIDRNMTASKLVQEALVTFLSADTAATGTILPGDMP
jgi:predicted transcriptional regulator